MTDDLHARRVGPMDWSTALLHMEARLDDLLGQVQGVKAILDANLQAVTGQDDVGHDWQALESRLSALENAGGTRLAEDWEPSGEDRLAAKRAGAAIAKARET